MAIDSTDEQARNLRETLGWDSDSSAPQRSSFEKDLTPLQRASKQTGVSEGIISQELTAFVRKEVGGKAYPNNLFSTGSTERFGADRVSYRFSSHGGNFIQTSFEATFYGYTDNARWPEKNPILRINHRGEGVDQVTSLVFLKDGNISAGRTVGDDRTVEFLYDASGRLVEARFTDQEGFKQIVLTLNKETGKFEKSMEVKEATYANLTPDQYPSFGSGAEMDYITDSKDGTHLEVSFSKDGEQTDEIVISKDLGKSSKKLMGDIYSPEVLENFTNPDVSLDIKAKQDIFRTIDSNWTVLKPTRKQ